MPDDPFIAELWSYANEVPMLEHPWFAGILDHRWTPEQIVLGEVQHYLRVRTNPVYFGYIAINTTTPSRTWDTAPARSMRVVCSRPMTKPKNACGARSSWG